MLSATPKIFRRDSYDMSFDDILFKQRILFGLTQLIQDNKAIIWIELYQYPPVWPLLHQDLEFCSLVVVNRFFQRTFLNI